MDAIELFHKNGKSTDIWYCSKCRIVHRTQVMAEKCCRTLICECGDPVEARGWTTCKPCRDRKSAERERAKFEKAKKIAIEDYSGQIVIDDDRWFYCIDDAIEWLIDNERAEEYLWACEERPLKIDAMDMLDHQVECADMNYDGWSDEFSRESIAELQKLLDGWLEKYPHHAWFQTNHTAIAIPPEAFKENVDEASAD